MRTLAPCRFVVLFALAGIASAQATLVVPTAFATIQAAIVAAVPGDTVLVLPGTYVETIDFLGKALTVRSVAGAAATTIDGNQQGSVVSFVSNEPPTSVLEGFTIRNGLGLTVVTGNFPRATAGGIHVAGASPTIRRCVVSNNQGGTGMSPATAAQTTGYGGAGGISASASLLSLSDCEFSHNVGGQGGNGLAGGLTGGFGGRGGAGGAYFGFGVPAAAPEVLRCTFVANHGGTGGGIVASPGVGSAGRGGDGGVELYITSTARLLQCVVHGNFGGDGGASTGTAGHGGHGGIDIAGPTAFAITQVLMRSCAITGNTGGNAGAGSNAFGGNGGGATGATSFTAIGSTIAGNIGGMPQPVGAVTGGFTVGGYMISSTTMRNCIVWGNTRAGVPSDLAVGGPVANVQNSDIGASTGTIVGGNNLSTDPLFVNLASGDVHLTAGSPCRHSGAAVANLPLFDVDGDPRTVGPLTDMGADEWDGLVGSREDFVLDLAVNGAFAPAVVTSTAVAGDTVAVRMMSPGGTFASTFAIVGIEPWLWPLPPSGPALLPELHLSAAASVLTWFAGGVGGSGITLATQLPPGLAGFALRVQAFALTPAATNGLFAASAARDLLL